MAGRDAFSGFHPTVNLLYFCLMLVFSMCLMDPACLLISLLCAVAYHIELRGAGGVRFSLRFLLPVMVLAAVVNPLFNHAGITILGYLPSGNPLTLESILYGVAAAVLLAAVLSLFACWNAVMTTDKFVYLFGRVIPAMSLVLSMTLRFIPRFRARYRRVREARACVGRDAGEGTLRRRMRNAAAVLSILLTWSMEDAVETADSMRARGYGLPGRTAFSLYRLDGRDRGMLLWLALCGAYVIAGWIAGGLAFRYYPSVRFGDLGAFAVSFRLAYLALGLTPVILNGREARRWRRLTSAI